MKKKFVIALSLMMVLSILAGCGGSQTPGATTDKTQNTNSQKEEPKEVKAGDKSNDNVIKLGAMFPTTGGNAPLGQSAMNALKLAVEKVNATGGIMNKKIEVVEGDDKHDTSEANKIISKFINTDKVNAMVSCVSSSIALAVLDQVVEKNIPFMSPTASNIKVTQKGKNVFRTIFTDPYQGKVLAEFSKKELKATEAAIMYCKSDDFSTGISKIYSDAYSAVGGKIVNFIAYEKDQKDFTTLVKSIKEKNAQVVFIADISPETMANVCKEIVKQGLNIKIVSADSWEGVAKLVNTKYDAYYTSGFHVDDKSKEAQDFVADYKNKYNSLPTGYAAFSYDATNIVINAIKKANSLDYNAIIDAMAKTEFVGATGKLKFDNDRNPVRSLTILKDDGSGKDQFYLKLDPSGK